MPRILRFLIFFLFFTFIYGFINYYPLSRIFSYFSLRKNIYFYLLVILMILSFFIASAYEHQYFNAFSKSLYYFASMWMGLIFILFFIVLVFDLLGLFITLDVHAAGIAVLMIAALLSSISMYNADNLMVKEFEIPVKNLDKDNPVTIVHLTDIHIGAVNGRTFLEKIINKTNSLDPDFVAITGDLFDGSGRASPEIIELLKSIKAKTFFVSGNHESYSDEKLIRSKLKNAGIILLENGKVIDKGIQFIGFDYAKLNKNNFNEEINSLKLNTSMPSIFLYHEPSFVKKGSRYFDLQLNGHTHNGQIFPFNLVVKIVYPYITGLYNVNNSYAYVSPGTGTWGPKMRLGSKNIIALFTLRKSENE